MRPDDSQRQTVLWLGAMMLLLGAVISSSAQTVRERVKEPGFRIYAVILGVTVNTNSAVPTVRLAKVIDPKSGTTNAVKMDVPETFMKTATKKIEAKHNAPILKDGKPFEYFTYFYFIPAHSNIVVVDLEKPIDKQP